MIFKIVGYRKSREEWIEVATGSKQMCCVEPWMWYWAECPTIVTKVPGRKVYWPDYAAKFPNRCKA